jgi:SAM-dependent methyltransferase
MRDCTPTRRRQRYGDIDYDWEQRVDTTSATVSFRDRLLGVFHSAYQPTEPQFFRDMIADLCIDYSQFTFVDVGSGKGRTLLMASDYPFRRILGVELLPNLHRIAQENIEKYRNVTQRCFNLQSICGDAREFDFPSEPLVLYLFNPFPEHVLTEVMQNLASSLRQNPRPVYVVYLNPLLEQALTRILPLKLVRRTQYHVSYVTGV